jgi:PadR family transcriptional regulator PadR
MARARDKTDLLRGTLDLLVLRTLELRPLHGVAIADRIRQLTGGTFSVQAGWIAGEWTTDQTRRVKSYTLTPDGRRQLTAEKRQWNRIVAAVGQVLDAG